MLETFKVCQWLHFYTKSLLFTFDGYMFYKKLRRTFLSIPFSIGAFHWIDRASTSLHLGVDNRCDYIIWL